MKSNLYDLYEDGERCEAVDIMTPTTPGEHTFLAAYVESVAHNTHGGVRYVEMGDKDGKGRIVIDNGTDEPDDWQVQFGLAFTGQTALVFLREGVPDRYYEIEDSGDHIGAVIPMEIQSLATPV